MAKNPPGVTSSTDANAPTPIGVPKGYVANVPIPIAPVAVDPLFAAAGVAPYAPLQPYRATPPRYFEGDQYAPASALSVDDMMDLQHKMEAAGLYSGTYTLGVWDQQTISAYSELLANSNAAGADETQTLTRMMAAPKQEKAKKRAPLVVELTNPDDIRNTVRHVAGQLYGGSLPDSTTEAIVNAVRDQETSAQTAEYNMGGTDGPGGTVTKPGNVQNLAEDTIRKEHPNEVAATQFADMFDSILSTMNTSPSNYQGIKYP